MWDIVWVSPQGHRSASVNWWNWRFLSMVTANFSSRPPFENKCWHLHNITSRRSNDVGPNDKRQPSVLLVCRRLDQLTSTKRPCTWLDDYAPTLEGADEYADQSDTCRSSPANGRILAIMREKKIHAKLTSLLLTLTNPRGRDLSLTDPRAGILVKPKNRPGPGM